MDNFEVLQKAITETKYLSQENTYVCLVVALRLGYPIGRSDNIRSYEVA